MISVVSQRKAKRYYYNCRIESRSTVGNFLVQHSNARLRLPRVTGMCSHNKNIKGVLFQMPAQFELHSQIDSGMMLSKLRMV